MSTESWQLAGMAKRKLMPAFLRTRSPFGTPTYAILFGMILILALSVFDFSMLVEMHNFNYAISLITEYFAFIRLRIIKSEVYRPFQIPLPTLGCSFLIIPPVLCTLLLLSMASWITWLYFFIFAIIGLFFYKLQEIAHRRKWSLFASDDSASEIIGAKVEIQFV